MAAAADDAGEDPRWRRSNTDCASFLSARFACSKGEECEYRHCEGARFNFRSCWYWFQGNCVNPSCTFRHPPLESLDRTKSFADPPPFHGSTCVKEASPCYFYYNSVCVKGDRCPFLHEPVTCNNAVETCSEATTTSNPTVNRNSAGAEVIQPLKNSVANQAEDSSDHINEHHSKGVTKSSNPNIFGAIPSATEASVDTCAHMKSSTHSDQSLEHSEMEHTEEDGSDDSSPGFDVLVDDRDSNKNDYEHQLAGERYASGPYMEYDGGDSVDYGLDYLDSECYEGKFSDFDSTCYSAYSYLDRSKEHDTVITLGHIPHNRRNLERSTFEEYDRRFIGPRNFISSKEDAVDHQNIKSGHRSKRRPENRKGGKGRNIHIKRCRGSEPSIGPEEIESGSTQRRQYSLMRDCSGPVVGATSRKHKKKSRRKQHHRHSAKLAEGNTNAKHPDQREDFTGPKTLAQIKEEKCRSKPSSQPNVCMPHARSSTNDFEGPKSLSELLKAKGR